MNIQKVDVENVCQHDLPVALCEKCTMMAFYVSLKRQKLPASKDIRDMFRMVLFGEKPKVHIMKYQRDGDYLKSSKNGNLSTIVVGSDESFFGFLAGMAYYHYLDITLNIYDDYKLDKNLRERRSVQGCQYRNPAVDGYIFYIYAGVIRYITSINIEEFVGGWLLAKKTSFSSHRPDAKMRIHHRDSIQRCPDDCQDWSHMVGAAPYLNDYIPAAQPKLYWYNKT